MDTLKIAKKIIDERFRQSSGEQVRFCSCMHVHPVDILILSNISYAVSSICLPVSLSLCLSVSNGN